MMQLNNIRRQSGGVLGLVTGLILIVFVIGISFLFGGRFIGGQLQLNHAADAGILNAAKLALINPGISLTDPTLPAAYASTYSDFNGLVDPNNNNCVDLLTYNRLVGQAMVVAYNAEYEGTDTAYKNAQQEILAVRAIGQAITNKMQQGVLDNSFLDLAQVNSLNMLGLTPTMTMQQSLKTSFVGQQALSGTWGNVGNPSNIWVDANILPGPWQTSGYWEIPFTTDANSSNPSQNFLTSVDSQYPGVTAMKYVPGYTDLYLLRNTPYETSLQAVPIITAGQGNTHLVDNTRFENSTNRCASPYVSPTVTSLYPTDTNVPPNALKASVTSNVKINPQGGTENNTNVTAIACAIVGSQTNGYVAEIPNGYIKITNGPDASSLATATLGAAGSNLASTALSVSASIFNNNLGNQSVGVYGVPMNDEISNGANVVTEGVLYSTTSFGYLSLTCWFNWLQRTNTWAAIPAQYQETISINGSNAILDIRLDPVYAACEALNMPLQTCAQLLAAGQNPTFTIGVFNSLTGNAATLKDLINMYVGVVPPGTNAPVMPVPIPGSTFTSPYLLNQTTFGNDGSSGAANSWLNYFEPQLASALGASNPLQTISTTIVPGGSSTVTTIAVLKAAIIDLVGAIRDGIVGVPRHNSETINVSNTISGIKYLVIMNALGQPVHYASPNTGTSPDSAADSGATPVSAEPGQVGTVGSLMSMIDSIANSSSNISTGTGTVSYNGMLAALTARMRQTNPNITAQNIQDALASQSLDLGQTAYLYANPSPSILSPNLVLCSLTPPVGATNPAITPDGAGSSQSVTVMVGTWDTFGSLIDTAKDGTSTAIGGDGNVHIQPYEQASPHPLAQTAATFTTSSGYNNFLGELDFTESTGVSQIGVVGLAAGSMTMTVEN